MASNNPPLPSPSEKPPVTLPGLHWGAKGPGQAKFLDGGFFLWVRIPRYRRKLMASAIAAVMFLVLSYLKPVWPCFLAAALAAVALGLVRGWCRVDFDRLKARGRWHPSLASRIQPLDPKGELDQLGFFNSRVAMRSPELFRIAIEDMPMRPDERELANQLVNRYWQARGKQGLPRGAAIRKDAGDGH